MSILFTVSHPVLFIPPCWNLQVTSGSGILFHLASDPPFTIKMTSMVRTSSQSFTDPIPPALQPATELRLFVALSPVQFAMLTDQRPILPDPYSLRFGLRTDPLKAFERAHYFMSWSAPFAEPPPQHSIKKYML